MKDETAVLDPTENEVSENEQLKIRKVTVGAYEGELTVKEYGSVLRCGTCLNTGCGSSICTVTCDTAF